MKDHPYIVIMAGGVGSRFWPYSKSSKPKQFLDVLGTGRTLLQMTFDRFLELAKPEQFFVVTNQSHVHLVREQLPELQENQILAEPLRKNTAACLAYASYKIACINSNATMIVAPADHLILQEGRFLQTLVAAISAAQEPNRLLTIGIKPNRPETGYGYIQYVPGSVDTKVLKVKTFTEKPNAKLAAIFTTVDMQDKVNFNSTNDQVLKVISDEAKSAISRSYNILRTRIDKFGVTQPNIQHSG